MSNGWLSASVHACVDKKSKKNFKKKQPLRALDMSLNFSNTLPNINKLKQSNMFQFYSPRRKKRKECNLRQHSLISGAPIKHSEKLFSRVKCLSKKPDKENELNLKIKRRLNSANKENQPFTYEISLPLTSDKNKKGRPPSIFASPQKTLHARNESTNTVKLNFSQFDTNNIDIDNSELSQPVVTFSKSSSQNDCENHVEKNNYEIKNENNYETDENFSCNNPSPLYFTEQMTNFNYALFNEEFSVDKASKFTERHSPLEFTEPFTECRQEDFYENSQAVLF